jgi:hypothetical protein
MEINKEIIEQRIQDINDKKSRFYFYLPEVDYLTGTVSYIYDLACAVKDQGYEVIVFYHEDEYKNEGWVTDEWASLTHKSFSQLNKEYKLRDIDFIFIPELYIKIVDEFLIQKIPSEIVMISQRHQFIFFNMEIGKRWDIHYNIKNVITTTKEQASLIKDYFEKCNVEIIEPFIPDYFKKGDKPSIPHIGLFTRNEADANRFIKQFYAKYPLFSWFQFRVFRDFSRENYAKQLQDLAFCVWIDEPSSFGTFPLEAMATEKVVLGIIPELVPEWMINEDKKLKNNGVWIKNKLLLPSQTAKMIEIYLQGNFPETIINEGKETANKFSKDRFLMQAEHVTNQIITKKIERLNLYKNKLNETEEV